MFGWLTRRRSRPSNSRETSATSSSAAQTSPADRGSPASGGDAKRIEGNARLDRGDLAGAEACYREALRLDPSSVAGHVNLAFVLLEQGRSAEAEQALTEAVRLEPGNVDANYMLGGLARSRGDLDAAILYFDRALVSDPSFERAYAELCQTCVDAGQIVLAELPLRRGIQTMPQAVHLHFLLGNVLLALGRASEAIACYDAALARQPGHAEAHANAAVALRSLGQLERAMAHLQSVATIRPGHLESQLQSAAVQLALGRNEAAIETYRRALAIDPKSVVALCGHGSALAAQRRSEEAIEQYLRALAADPGHHLAHVGLGVELNELGRSEEAVDCLRRAVEFDPTSLEAHSSMLFMLSFLAGPLDYLQAARRYGAKAQAAAGLASSPLASSGVLSGPLRVGFVSGDLYTHPVAQFLESALVHLDRAKVVPFAYVTSSRQDAVTARLRPHFAGWTSIVGMDDRDAARRIHADGIHVLVDLAGHTGSNRLSVFAWRPAPVQATWLGYLASSGLSTMDYVLADRASLPEASQDHFVERVWYLPNSLNCFNPPIDAPDVGPLPALGAGHVTFGSYQRMNKVGDETLRAWARILREVPDARLRLQNKQLGDDRVRAQIVERLKAHGLPVDRLVLVGPIPDRKSYLASHDQVDIVLDTFRYPGITTTCEALWMGVPTVTLPGETLLSRQGASLLHCVDLDEWVATDVDDYVRRAVGHASDRKRLAALRAGLRERARMSPLFDAPRFARDLEAALFGMWQRTMSEG